MSFSCKIYNDNANTKKRELGVTDDQISLIEDKSGYKIAWRVFANPFGILGSQCS